jgi:hypothetical protein
MLLVGACGGSGGDAADAGVADSAPTVATAPSGAVPAQCPAPQVVAADLGIEGLGAVADIPAPTATTTLVCGWAVGRIGEEGAATVRFSVDTLPDAATAAHGYEFSRQTMGSCARTDSCDPGDDVADDVFEGDERTFVTSDVSDLTEISDGPFFSTVIVAAARDGDSNCSLAVNIGSADRAVLTAPVRPARRAVADYCRTQGE